MALQTTPIVQPTWIGDHELGKYLAILETATGGGVPARYRHDGDSTLVSRFKIINAWLGTTGGVSGLTTYVQIDMETMARKIINVIGAINTKNGYYPNGAVKPTLTSAAPLTSVHTTPTTVTFTGTNFPFPKPATTSVTVTFNDGTVWASPTVTSATTITASATDAAAKTGTATVTINDGVNVTNLTSATYTFT